MSPRSIESYQHNDGSQDKLTVPLAPGNQSQWEQFTTMITATENYKMVTVYVAYKKPGGSLWVDDISLSLRD